MSPDEAGLWYSESSDVTDLICESCELMFIGEDGDLCPECGEEVYDG